MRGIGPPREGQSWLRRYRVEVAWAAACAAEIFAMIVWPGDMFEVPLLATLFVGMAWQVSRRVDALRVAEERADERSSLLERQERFIQDASHELRTPVTIARGHLELLRPDGVDRTEVEIALDELERIDAIIGRLLLLAAADQPDFVVPSQVELEEFLEDVFMRWSEIAPRAWQLGPLAAGRLHVDSERLRAALDALIENAVKYTREQAVISLRARPQGVDWVVIEVEDEGTGIPEAALRQIFDRFGRADAARTRSDGGVGLGLAIVDAIAKSHGGRCTVRSSPSGSAFALHLPGFTAVKAPSVEATPASVPTLLNYEH